LCDDPIFEENNGVEFELHSRSLGRKREVAGCWRKLHNEEFHVLFSSAVIIRGIVKEDAMSDAYSLHARSDKCVYKFGWEI
jgi:hypothetical protein